MDNEMEAGGLQRFKELKLSYYIGKPYYLLYIYIYYIPIMVTYFKFLSINQDKGVLLGVEDITAELVRVIKKYTRPPLPPQTWQEWRNTPTKSEARLFYILLGPGKLQTLNPIHPHITHSLNSKYPP